MGIAWPVQGTRRSEAPMLYYYTAIEHQPAANTATTECTWLIQQGRRDNPRAPAGDWRLFWSVRAQATLTNCCECSCGTPATPARGE